MASFMTKHNDIRNHCTKEFVDAKTINVVSIPTTKMLADGLTKALPEAKHTMMLRSCMGAKIDTS
jgi:hypothetical protein